MKLSIHESWPEPGVYANVPYHIYAALPAARASILKDLAVMTPEKAKFRADNPKSTPAMEEGIILHTFMLEPERFSRECKIAQPCEELLKSGQRKGLACGADTAKWDGKNWVCAKHRDGDGESGITTEFYRRLQVAHRKIWEVAGDVFRGIATGDTCTEVTLIWIDPQTEVLCKCRLDLYQPEQRHIYDIKKCRSADANVFGGDVGILRYDLQSSWYRRGAKACFGGGIYNFSFIGVELNKDEANGVQVLVLDEKADSTGEKAAQSALEVYADCIRTGIWPGYSASPKLVSLRPYIVRHEELLSGE